MRTTSASSADRLSTIFSIAFTAAGTSESSIFMTETFGSFGSGFAFAGLAFGGFERAVLPRAAFELLFAAFERAAFEFAVAGCVFFVGAGGMPHSIEDGAAG